jgi:hypothetical protein
MRTNVSEIRYQMNKKRGHKYKSLGSCFGKTDVIKIRYLLGISSPVFVPICSFDFHSNLSLNSSFESTVKSCYHVLKSKKYLCIFNGIVPSCKPILSKSTLNLKIQFQRVTTLVRLFFNITTQQMNTILSISFHCISFKVHFLK